MYLSIEYTQSRLQYFLQRTNLDGGIALNYISWIMNSKLLIGLIGGIGSGKSTAAMYLTQYGCGLIDADQIAHAVLDRPEMIREITAVFGRQVISSAGHIDRKQLAEIVFSSQEKLNRLTELIHPRVLICCEELIRQFEQDPTVEAIVLDMPLLFEVGWEKRCDFLVFIDCSEAKRAERLRKKGVLDIEQQKKRENFQISLDKKKMMAHYIIDNNSDESELAKQVETVFSAIRDRR